MKRFYHKKRSKGESRKLVRLFASNQQLRDRRGQRP